MAELADKYRTRKDCLSLLEELRWPEGVACPRCSGRSVSRIKTRDIFECNGCRYQFSATSGTVFHRTHLPLRKWILAAALICNAKKGVSAKQIERDLKVTYKTAWYLMHRIRKAMNEPGLIQKFTGIVEADETYVGGKAKGRGRGRRGNKRIIMGVRERGGAVKAEPAFDLSANILCRIVRKYTDTKAQLVCTDEAPQFNYLYPEYRPGRVNHSRGEYVRGIVHTNSIESFWNILKRGIVGSYHKVSTKWLPRYLNEFCYRFSHTHGGNGVGLWKTVLQNGVNTDPETKG